MSGRLRLPDRLIRILRSAEQGDSASFPPTEIFNEGWMLRLVLDAVQSLEMRSHPLAFEPGARWYSEALLESPFRASRRGDPLAEGFTNADAVIGHFEFRPSTKAGLTLSPGGAQFVVTEAKMFSNLSAGTRNARDFNQAARNVACMAWALAQSGRSIADFGSLGFHVIAPEISRRGAGISNIETSMDPGRIREAVSARIAAYGSLDEARHAMLREWEAGIFEPFLDHLARVGGLGVLSWESCITDIEKVDAEAGHEIAAFYERCLTYSSSTPQIDRAPVVEPEA